MTSAASAREVLLAEAIGDLGALLNRAEELTSSMNESRRALIEAQTQLSEQLNSFEGRIAAMTTRAQVHVMKQVLARTHEAAQQSIKQNEKAMADAARIALGAELGAATQRLQTSIERLVQRAESRAERWLLPAAIAVTSSALTVTLTMTLAAH